MRVQSDITIMKPQHYRRQIFIKLWKARITGNDIPPNESGKHMADPSRHFDSNVPAVGFSFFFFFEVWYYLVGGDAKEKKKSKDRTKTTWNFQKIFQLQKFDVHNIFVTSKSHDAIKKDSLFCNNIPCEDLAFAIS